ncbi:MAG: LLM class flavin-dependent oxidoreductase [Acidimicrobiales bacterium]
MTLANTAWDLQTVTGGRFALGLGTQVRPHVVERFGMPWSQPAARMRELVLADPLLSGTAGSTARRWRCVASSTRTLA